METDELSTGDIATAFLQGYDFDETMEQQYVGLRAYPGAEVDVWEYNGPIYGDEVAPANLHKTFSDFMTDEMQYELMTKKQVEAMMGVVGKIGFKQCDNEMSLYYNPKTGLTVGKWVDDLIVRGQRSEQDKFWNILNKRFDIKTFGYVEEDSPRVFCSKEIALKREDGIKWYSISQANDIKQWLTDMGMAGVIPVSTPMVSKKELYSNENLLDEQEATDFRSKLGSLQYYGKETRDDIAAEVMYLQVGVRSFLSCLDPALS